MVCFFRNECEWFCSESFPVCPALRVASWSTMLRKKCYSRIVLFSEKLLVDGKVVSLCSIRLVRLFGISTSCTDRDELMQRCVLGVSCTDAHKLIEVVFSLLGHVDG